MLPWFLFATWKRWKFSPVIEFHSSVFQHLVQLVSDTYFVITLCLKMPQIFVSLLCYWKNKFKKIKNFLCYWRKKEKTLDPDGRIPLKLVDRVDRAASQQTLQEKVFEETHHCNKEWSYLKVYNQKRHWLAEMNTEQSCRRGKEHVLQHSSVQLWNPPKHVYSCTRTSDSSFRLSVCTKFTLKSPARSYNTL